MFVFKTIVHARVEPAALPIRIPLPKGLRFGAELLDARVRSGGEAALNTTVGNAANLLRAYVEYESPELLGGRFVGRAGRITMNVGSRRFVARNRFRNTINGFTGFDFRWQSQSENALHLRGFWALPVTRLPGDARGLRRNDVDFDEESRDVQFFGLFAARNLAGIGRGEIYGFGLLENLRGTTGRPTSHRRLATSGFRLFSAPKTGHFDFTTENAVQFGRSRASASSTRELTHRAHFHHLTLGYSFDAMGSPRFAVQYDYASGDDDPSDGRNGRFDTLFGARRFDFNPTGIYGPFARSNLHTPGLRLQLRPLSRVTATTAYRLFWLASAKDTWTTSGVRDATGDAGRFVGHQFEIRIRYDLVPGNVRLETGYAHLFAGDFIDDAPNSPARGDSNYAYFQASVAF